MQQVGKKTGFTIVELLIAVVIIAILAGITIVAYNNVQDRSYYNRAQAEMSQIARALALYEVDHADYPDDVDRGVPAVIYPYLDGSDDDWPDGPWPGSVYDYDNIVGSDGNEVIQISLRFCPISGPLSACNFPDEAWAEDFGVNSSAYWCIKGICRPHESQADDYPGYCINCRD